MSYERKDAPYRQAKAAGYRARSAYKLLELDRRHRLLRSGDRVLDLGAWPGAWLQVAAERVAPSGRIVGIDLAEPAPLSGVSTIVGDVRDPAVQQAAIERLGGPATVVLCDLAPKLTGIRDTDEARSTELLSAVIDALPTLLQPGGRLAMKLFMNASQPALVRRLEQSFTRVQVTRPEASRRGSAELYAVATGHRPSCG